ncbi:SRPBCC family protein [Pseudarthrobacter sp. alpha12b]
MTKCQVITFDLSVVINRPPSAVFALLADVQDFEPIPHDAAVRMFKDPAGPTTVGTRWHEWVRLAPGCWFHTESVVSGQDYPHRLGIDFTSRWLTGHLTYDIEAAGDGSTLHYREILRPRRVPRWLLPFIGRTMRPHLLQRLADIKQILESTPANED